MIRGIIETESLIDKSIISDLNPIKVVTETHPDSTTSHIWHINLISMSTTTFRSIKKRISENLLSDWYAIFWNHNNLFIIFKNKIFTIPKKYSKQEYNKIKNFGLSYGIQEKYLVLNQEEVFQKYLK